MAINKAVLKTIKAVSFAHIDVKNKYQKIRHLYRLAHPFFSDISEGYIFADSRINDIPIRTFIPDVSESEDILIFFHGGGWVIGDIESYSHTCSVMCCETKRCVIAVEYRKAPENKFPDGLYDCYEAVKKIAEDKKENQRIILIGDSAGGNLSAAVCLMAREKKEFEVDAQILIYPAVFNDHSENSPFKSVHECGNDYFLTSHRVCDYAEMYAKSPEDYNNPLFAPLLAENHENLPPALILTAEYDPLRDEGEAYGEKLRSAGNYAEIHRIEDALHGFITLPLNFKIVQQSYNYINEFLDKAAYDNGI